MNNRARTSLIAELLIPALPHIRLSMQMQNSQNNSPPLFCEKVYAVWEMTEEGTTNIALHTWKLVRIVLDTLEDKVEFVEEPRCQAGPLVFVPQGSCQDVEVRLRLDDELPGHP